MARIAIISFALGAAIVASLKLANPLMQVPPLWKMLLAIPAFYGYVLAMLAIHLLLPSHIEVRKDRMHVMTGQSHWFVKSEAVRRTRIVFFAVDRIRLRVFYEHKEKQRSRTFGVGRKVNLDELARSLAVAPEIWDARSRYRDPRGSVA
jgi:hypothetical protein